jgi:hypothetical protein
MSKRLSAAMNAGREGSRVPQPTFLICAVALARKWQILTTDAGFKNYAKAMPIVMYPLVGWSW